MSILTRISSLFKADIHGILDNLEQPEIVLKQAIRDMQDEIEKATATIGILCQQQDRMRQKKLALSEYIQELKHQLQFCFNEDNENLAKSVVRKKLQAEITLNQLSAQLKNIDEEIKQLTNETKERQEKLENIREKLTLFSEQAECKENAQICDTTTSITTDDVELAFLHEKKRFMQASENGEQL